MGLNTAESDKNNQLFTFLKEFKNRITISKNTNNQKYLTPS